jgi:protein-S-isoprenylcysteine O-methyltransferase Ste14
VRYFTGPAEVKAVQWLEQMDSIRYYLALILLIGVPPACVYWLVVHPMAGFWQRLGPGWTFSFVGALFGVVMVALFLARGPLLATEFGTSPLLIALAIPCLSVGAVIEFKCRKHLHIGTLIGLPELDPGRHPPKLLSEGIYARIRHPRYVAGTLSLLGNTLVANYLAVYVVFALLVPALYLIAVLEERELRERFGSEYEAYSRRVPRFVPKRGR